MTEKRKYDVLAIGELNVDLILNDIDGFPEIGKEITAGGMTLTLGSSTAIFAANLASLGAKVSFLGKTGNDLFGKLVIEQLTEKQVDTSNIIQDDQLKTGATIVMNYAEDRANVTHMGAMEHFTVAEIDANILRQTRHMHLSSCFMQPGLKPDLVSLFQMARELGCTTSMDTQWDPQEKWDLDLEALLPFIDLFLPNEKELCLLTGCNTYQKALEKIQPRANTVVVKRGSLGSVMLKKDGTIIEQSAFLNKHVIDAIGAGDSFNAGYIYSFIKNQKPGQCLSFGSLTGAINTTAAGGTKAFSSKQQIIDVAREKFGQTITL